MRIFFFFIAYFLALNLSAQCGNRYKTNLFPVETTTHTFGENYRYDSSLQILKLDLYSPKNDSFKLRPCLVFCFGGAFVSGTRTSLELIYFADYLTKLGYVCASIDYRLDNTANMTSKGENGAVIRAVQDAKAAIRFLKSKHNEFGIDSNQIFIGGTSAGGVTALTLGYAQYAEFDANIRAKIDSLGGWEGKTNLINQSSKVKGLFNFSGAVLDTNQIQANDLPVYLNHATQDAVVPYYKGYPLNGQSTTLMYGSGSIESRMKNLGNFYQIDSFKTAAHPAFQDLGTLGKTAESLKQFLYKVLKCDQTNLSINSENESTFKFSNPSNGNLFLTHFIPNATIEIYNLVGKKRKSISANYSVDISSLSKGIYLLKYQDKFYKLIKE